MHHQLNKLECTVCCGQLKQKKNATKGFIPQSLSRLFIVYRSTNARNWRGQNKFRLSVKKPIQYSNRFMYAKNKNHMIDELCCSHIHTRIHNITRSSQRKHKKTRTRKWDKEENGKKSTKKKTDDLKGKHFSCYPFLTSFLMREVE